MFSSFLRFDSIAYSCACSACGRILEGQRPRGGSSALCSHICHAGYFFLRFYRRHFRPQARRRCCVCFLLQRPNCGTLLDWKAVGHQRRPPEPAVHQGRRTQVNINFWTAFRPKIGGFKPERKPFAERNDWCSNAA